MSRQFLWSRSGASSAGSSRAPRASHSNTANSSTTTKSGTIYAGEWGGPSASVVGTSLRRSHEGKSRSQSSRPHAQNDSSAFVSGKVSVEVPSVSGGSNSNGANSNNSNTSTTTTTTNNNNNNNNNNADTQSRNNVASSSQKLPSRLAVITKVKECWLKYAQAHGNKHAQSCVDVKWGGKMYNPTSCQLGAGEVVPSYFEINASKDGLVVYGPAFQGLSYDPLIHRDRRKFVQSLGLVKKIDFRYTHVSSVIAQIPKLRQFRHLHTVRLHNNHITALHQLDPLVVLRLRHLWVTGQPLTAHEPAAEDSSASEESKISDESGNPEVKKDKGNTETLAGVITCAKLLRVYAIFRFPELEAFNGEPVTKTERSQAVMRFQGLSAFWKQSLPACAHLTTNILRNLAYHLNKGSHLKLSSWVHRSGASSAHTYPSNPYTGRRTLDDPAPLYTALADSSEPLPPQTWWLGDTLSARQAHSFVTAQSTPAAEVSVDVACAIRKSVVSALKPWEGGVGFGARPTSNPPPFAFPVGKSATYVPSTSDRDVTVDPSLPFGQRWAEFVKKKQNGHVEDTPLAAPSQLWWCHIGGEGPGACMTELRPNSSIRQASKRYVDKLVSNTVAAHKKVQELRKVWPLIMRRYVQDTLEHVEIGRYGDAKGASPIKRSTIHGVTGRVKGSSTTLFGR